ncbi:cation:proton antiporter [Chloroflexota bacterium]
MNEIAQVIAFVGILVFLAHLFTGIFSRTRIPDVLLLTIIGIVIGPLFGLTSPSLYGAVGPVFTTVTLVIILFESGIALKLGTLRKALGSAATLAPLSFLSTMAVVAGLAIWLVDLEILPAFILGAIVGSTSEAVVIPLIRQLRIKEETRTLLSVESSVNDVLSIVITVALVQAYVLGSFQIASISGDLIASFIVAAVFGVVGAFIWSALLSRIHAVKNTIFTTPAFVFVIYGLVEILGFSGAIASLSFGITIGNIESIRIPFFRGGRAGDPVGLSGTEKIFFGEVAFLLKTFFFVYLGISLELISMELILVGLAMTIVAFALRVPAVKLISRGKFSAKDSSIMAIMVPKGLAAVVLAYIPLQAGVTGGETIKNIIYGVVLLSIVLTSIMVLLMERTRVADFYAWMLGPGWIKFHFRKTRVPMMVEGKTESLTPYGTKLFGRSQKDTDKVEPRNKPG